MRNLPTFFFGAFFLLLPFLADASLGVGVGLGSVKLDGGVKPGSIVDLPLFPVTNTGDTPGEYEIGIEYQEDVPQMRPGREWFVFDEAKFHLDPKETKLAHISMRVPISVEPGEYFAYLEARPAKVISDGSTGASVGIAAATKLYFSVDAANIWEAAYYRARSFWNMYTPWPAVAIGVLLAIVAVLILRRFISFHIGITKRGVPGKEPAAVETDRQSIGLPGNVDEPLREVLHEVEVYTDRLSEDRVERLFAEAGRLRPDLQKFFYDGDRRVLSIASSELRDVLSLLHDRLERARKQDPITYQKLVDRILSGFSGD